MSETLFRICRPRDEGTRLTLLLLALVVALGTVLRFWGLGNIGLHGDEDVMALAVRGILDTGAPTLPSGMLYPRALPQLYLMALSVLAFGDSEWALRLPSAVTGSLMILIGYALARRFLTVRWSLLFAATIALLPELIAVSQTARMYVFYVALVMLFGVAIFRWERTGTIRDWVQAVLACIAGLALHSLTVFASLLYFYPGIVKRSWRLLGFGAAGFAVSVGVFKLLAQWNSDQYFPLVSPDSGDAGAAVPESLQHVPGLAELGVGAAVVLIAAAAAWFAGRRERVAERLWLTAGAGLLVTALAAAMLIQYHVAALAWFFGAVFYVRAGRSALVPVAAGVVLAALFGWHAFEASQSPAVRSLFDFAEAMLGTPKPLSYLTFASFSPIGFGLYVLLLIYFAVGFARRRPLPDHVLLFLIAVFAPLFLIGFFEDRYVPPRYVIGMLPFFALCLFAGLQQVLSESRLLSVGSRLSSRRAAIPAQAFAAVAALAVFVSPSDLRYNVNPQYADFGRMGDHRGVDHKGAAEYVIGEDAAGDDLVIVMDTQQQGYYLPKRADYYMRSLYDGRNSTIMREGRMRSLYTGLPQIASGAELEKVVRESQYDEVLIVGSGELEHNLDRYVDDGIWTTMQKLGFEQVWLGRDGATPVWRYAKPGATATADTGGSQAGASETGDSH